MVAYATAKVSQKVSISEVIIILRSIVKYYAYILWGFFFFFFGSLAEDEAWFRGHSKGDCAPIAVMLV